MQNEQQEGFYNPNVIPLITRRAAMDINRSWCRRVQADVLSGKLKRCYLQMGPGQEVIYNNVQNLKREIEPKKKVKIVKSAKKYTLVKIYGE